jgi:hypothetical protein
MAVLRYGKSIPEIFTDVVTNLTLLVRNEGRLARVEISENVTKVAAGLGLVVGGAVLLIPALVILLQALVTVMVQQLNMTPPLAALIAGGIVLVVGLILLLVGIGRIKLDTLMPDRTIHQIQQDAAVAKDQVRQPYDTRPAA